MKKIIISSCLLFISISAFATENINTIIKSQEQFEEQKRQFKKLEEKNNNKILFYKSKKPKLLKNKSGNCFFIKKINERSLTLLSQNEKINILKKYLFKCNTIEDLKNLVKELNSLYIDKGYITSKVFLKPQNISNGIIELFAIEGKIENIKKNDLYLKLAFFLNKEEYLNLRDLEVGIENINRLSSNNAKLKLEPGSKVGHTIVDIENKTTKRLNGQISLNNYGQEITGKEQIGVNINWENPFRINDKISVNYNTTDNHNKFENSIGDTYSYSFPIGRLLFTLSYSKSKYKQIIKAQINKYSMKGKSQTYKLNMNYKLYHDQRQKISYKTFIKHYKTQKYLENSKLETSTYNLSQLGLGLDYFYQTPSLQSLISFEYMKGINLFNVFNPTKLDENYEKYILDLNFVKQFSPFKYSFVFHLQHTKDKLFGVEQISIGGPYSVRGFKEEGLSGNNGLYYRNELSYTIPKKLFSFQPNIYFGLDGGWIKKEQDTSSGNLLGEFIGIKLNSKSISTDIYYSKALDKSSVSTNKNFLGFNLVYKF